MTGTALIPFLDIRMTTCWWFGTHLLTINFMRQMTMKNTHAYWPVKQQLSVRKHLFKNVVSRQHYLSVGASVANSLQNRLSCLGLLCAVKPQHINQRLKNLVFLLSDTDALQKKTKNILWLSTTWSSKNLTPVETPQVSTRCFSIPVLF